MKPFIRQLAATSLMLGIVGFNAQAEESPSKILDTNRLGYVDPATVAQFADLAARQRAVLGLVAQAKASLNNGEVSDAFALLQEALNTDTTDGEVRMLLARIYAQRGQPDGVIAVLAPIVDYSPHFSSSVGQDIHTRYMYILALLDRNAWSKAVDCYERTQRANLNWFLPQGGPNHLLPNPKFSPDTPDYAGLGAQAHLVLGARTPGEMEEKDELPYMLGHLQQVLQTYPNSLDASFLSGYLLGHMNRFSEARAAYAAAAKLGSPAVQKEINAELKKVAIREQTKKAYDARQTALQAKPK